uniref:NADH dehydrogenase subunit 4L n=1 Tax=Ochthephilus vulgaris TaxID=3078931 RepID=UPI002A83DB51|nr:NADH dehydrogenase subunit 4L [Ochthephilus vulgaris]WON66026.1 NADH dehydrogenase subunit 4L [Ochthephilus vulgaris]
MYIYVIFVLMYFSGLMVFCMKRKHFLLMLLSLEFIMMSLYLGLFMYLGMFTYEYYFLMVFLTMSVCEGVLGLSILVSLSRSHGNDYYQTFNMLW